MNGTKKSAKSTIGDTTTSAGFTDEERAAMKERAQEVKATRCGSRTGKANGESDVLAKIAEMPESDRTMAERLHNIIKANAPTLSPRLWYGMPAYAKNGEVVCFFQGAHKFKTRYATLGFNDSANLDEGAIWLVIGARAERQAFPVSIGHTNHLRPCRLSLPLTTSPPKRLTEHSAYPKNATRRPVSPSTSW